MYLCAWTGFHLPCRHIFFIRRQQGCDEVDTALVDRRWLLPCANTKSGTAHNSTGRVVVCNLPVAAETNGQRFKSLMSVFTPMASALAELSRSEFAKCMEWVSGLELQVRDGTWRDNLTIPHVPSSDGNDDAASSEPTTSSHAMHSLSDGQADNRFDGEAMSVPDGDLETVDDMPPQADNNSDVEPENVDATPLPVPTPAASTFQLPRRVQQRGRPALSKQRTFRIKKRKCKTGDDASTVAASSNAASSVDVNAAENCVECGRVEPPKRGRGATGKTVKWTQCDRCDFWYHDLCISRDRPHSSEAYVCARCTDEY